MASGDPFNWTPEEASQFFRHCLPQFLLENGFGDLKLPDTDDLADQLLANDLDGRDVLEGLDHDLLKNDFGITAIKPRLSVVRVIKALRKGSAGYADKTAPTARIALPTLPTPHASAPHTPTAHSNNVPPIGAHTRRNEELVQDSTGRKRRKLNPSAVQTIKPHDAQAVAAPGTLPDQDPIMVDVPSPKQQQSPKSKRTTPGYLPDKGLPIDSIFYGDARFGQETASPDSDSETEDNFTMTAPSPFTGNASYVHGRLRSMFLNSRVRSITYHQNPAVALYPYPEGAILDKDSRSVTVFQADKDRVKVFREKDLTLSYQHEEVVEVQADPGTEWSFLLKKYGGSGKEQILPAYGESESDEGLAEEQIGSVSGTDDDMAEEDQDNETNVLPKHLVAPIIDRMIENQAQKWREEKQPKLDKTKARKVWRQGKGKVVIAKTLIEAAMKNIDQLEARLEGMRDRLTERTWDDEKELERACEILEPTVQDRELQEWNIRTWALKKEPERQLQERKPSHHQFHNSLTGPMHQREGEDDDMHDFIEEDSFEDAREHISENGLDEANQDTTMQDDGDMAELPNAFDEDHGEPVIDFDDETAELPNAFDEDDGEPAIDLEGETAEVPQDFDHTDRSPHPSSVASERPKLSPDMNLDETLTTPKILKTIVIPPLDSPDLPSPSTFKIRSSQNSAKKKPEIIDLLSSDPAEPLPSPARSLGFVKSEPTKYEPIKFSDNPDNDSPKDILNWKYEELETANDRRRLMLKLAFDLKDEWRQSLLPLLTGNMSTCISNVQFALISLREGQEYYPEYSPAESEAMRLAARLYCCWIKVDHTMFHQDAPTLSKAVFGENWPFDDDELEDDLRNWHQNAKKAIQKAERFSKSEESQRIVIDLSDDDDDFEQEQSSRTTPRHKKRKRAIEESQPALLMRAKAAERAERYESQHSPTKLLALVAGDEDNVVPLYAPEDVDPSKHVYLNPGIAKRLKPHQIEGVKFMWREITAPKDEDGQGCLLAHTMGLGKTAQSLALVSSLAETAKSKDKRDALPEDLRGPSARKRFRVLVLCPPSLLQNWKQEIKMWCPKGLFGDTHTLDATASLKIMRLDSLRTWKERGGIMIIGYTMFAKLLSGKAGGKTQRFTEDEQKEVEDVLLNKPLVVVADEVHMIKTDTSGMSTAAHKFRTLRRIGLTGSPMSNNTQEIYSLINWVAPGFLGTKPEFKANYAEPIEAGTYVDSSRYEVRRSLTKLAALKRIIGPKLNRADITVLKGSLKSKVEFVLTIPLTDVQKLGYEKYVELILRGKAGEEGTTVTQVKLFGWLSILQLLCNHPRAFRNKLLEPKDADKTKKPKKPSSTPAELAAPASTAAGLSGTPRAAGSPADEEDAIVLADQHVSQYDIDKVMIDELVAIIPDQASIELSYKTLLVRQIMRLSISAGDKVLIFSQSIPSLNFLEMMLTDCGARFGRIQGDMNQAKRIKELEKMQNGELDVLLISTRAGSLGLNIQQANRVIIFDFGFNPTWEEQAVGRAYRLGQSKPVFVYRFVAGGTFEWQLYDKQIFKTGLASRVVDRKNPTRNANKKPSEWLYAPQHVPQGDIHSEAGKDPHVMDKIIASHNDENDSFIRGIKTMETLMSDARDEELTAEELAAVEEDVTNARTRKKAAFENRTTLPALPQVVPRGHQPSTRPLNVSGVAGLSFNLGPDPPSLPVNHTPSAVPGSWPQNHPQRAKDAFAQQATAQEATAQQAVAVQHADGPMPPPEQANGIGSSEGPSRIIGRY